MKLKWNHLSGIFVFSVLFCGAGYVYGQIFNKDTQKTAQTFFITTADYNFITLDHPPLVLQSAPAIRTNIQFEMSFINKSSEDGRFLFASHVSDDFPFSVGGNKKSNKKTDQKNHKKSCPQKKRKSHKLDSLKKTASWI